MTPEKFRALAASWMKVPFPKGSDNDELDEIHAILVGIDSWVADCMLSYLHCGAWVPSVPDVFGALDALEADLDGLSLKRDVDKAKAESYRRYAGMMRDIYRDFLELGPQSKSSGKS